MAERCIAGPEIVEGYPAAQLLQNGNEFRTGFNVFEPRCFGDFNCQTFSEGALVTENIHDMTKPGAISGGQGGDVHRQPGIGICVKDIDREIENAAVYQPNKSQLFDDGHKLACDDNFFVWLPHPQQTFVELRFQRIRTDDRLVR